MERLTDHRTAEAVRENIEGLQAKGIEVSVSDLIYVKLAEYEDKEEEESRGVKMSEDNNKVFNSAEYCRKLKIENKELKRYLREAIAGFRKLGKALNDDAECDGDCENCALNNRGNCLKWRLESEVLFMIGDKDNG